MPKPVSIAIVEDHPPTASLWVRVVRHMGHNCAGRFASAESAWKALRRAPPTLVLLDWGLPGRNGGWLATKMHELHPGVLFLVLTCHDEVPVLREAIGVPVNGFVRKPVALKELIRRIEEVLAGRMPLATQHGQVLCPAAQSSAQSSLSPLSSREREIVWLDTQGDTAKEMAEKLHISVGTIPTYKKRITRKLNARHFKEAVALAASLPNWCQASSSHAAGSLGATLARV